MIRLLDAPASDDPARTSLVAGADLEDALAIFGQQQDCIGCSTAIATTAETATATVEFIRRTFSALSKGGPTIRPRSGTKGLIQRGSWTEVDIDNRAQRLHSVRMPAELVSAQRLIAVIDLRATPGVRPTIAIGLWAQFAHPLVRLGARLGGETDGLTAEIALAVHPDRYVVVEKGLKDGTTYVLATPDIVVAELIVLSLRDVGAQFRGKGPWEDPLVQAATDLDLGVRSAEAIDIDAYVSPTLSSEQRDASAAKLLQAAERIGVELAR
jgi:hypothetical protein